jgi:hypothetical protein
MERIGIGIAMAGSFYVYKERNRGEEQETKKIKREESSIPCCFLGKRLLLCAVLFFVLYLNKAVGPLLTSLCEHYVLN